MTCPRVRLQDDGSCAQWRAPFLSQYAGMRASFLSCFLDWDMALWMVTYIMDRILTDLEELFNFELLSKCWSVTHSACHGILSVSCPCQLGSGLSGHCSGDASAFTFPSVVDPPWAGLCIYFVSDVSDNDTWKEHLTKLLLATAQHVQDDWNDCHDLTGYLSGCRDGICSWCLWSQFQYEARTLRIKA